MKTFTKKRKTMRHKKSLRQKKYRRHTRRLNKMRGG